MSFDPLSVGAAIENLDISIFDRIESQTTDDDRRSLLAIQRAVRSLGEYVYLEIGSHLGGTLQPHLLDPLCTKIFSIDPRLLTVEDERGEKQRYFDNSTQRMMRLLSELAPDQVGKIKTFDATAPDVNPAAIDSKPHLCFIDGEHTNRAAVADFDLCIKVVDRDGAIVFHDSDLVYKGIRQELSRLRHDGVRHTSMKVGGSVFAIALGNSPLISDTYLRSNSQNTAYHFLRSGIRLWIKQLKNRGRDPKP